MGSSLALKTVLVVEDDEGVLLLLTEVLENSGYRVCSFFNPIDALEDARRAPPDLIVLDWYLPFMNGQAFLGHLGQVAPRIPPVVVLTGDVNLRKASGIAEVLVKPVSLDVLLERIAVLSGRAEPAAADGLLARA